MLGAFMIMAGVAACVVLVLGAHQREKGDRYSIGAVAVIVVLAVAGAGMLGRTPFFPLACGAVGLLLLVHHTLIHWSKDFSDECCGCACFQLKDVSNHETWVVATAVAAVVSAVGA